jgi:hypothetical protein
VIFGVVEIITVFVGKDIILAASFEMVNTYVAIISTVFATSAYTPYLRLLHRAILTCFSASIVWSSTTSFKEAIGQNDSLASSRPVVFRMNQTKGTTNSGPVRDLNTHDIKPEYLDEFP